MSSPEVLLRRLTRNLKATRSLLRHLISAPPPPLPSLPCSPPLSFSRRRLLSPLPGLAAGSLFLSSPAWKLSQSATPLHFQGNPESFKTEASPEASKPVGEARGAAGNGGGEAEENSVWNLPNLISISRMISGPVIGWMIIHEWYFTSFVSLAVSGMTDWLDGFVARKMNINSVLGSYLDPLADKVLIGCVAVAMVKRDLLHPGVVLLVVVRDVGLVGGAVYKRASTMGWQWRSWYDFANLNTTHPEKVEPLFISKVNTVFQLILVATALLQPDFGSENTEWCITYLSWLVASTTVASSIAYGVQHLRRLPA